jgi:hypothetical protein
VATFSVTVQTAEQKLARSAVAEPASPFSSAALGDAASPGVAAVSWVVPKQFESAQSDTTLDSGVRSALPTFCCTLRAMAYMVATAGGASALAFASRLRNRSYDGSVASPNESWYALAAAA